jgi:O-antigen/teichoic acid export membrane protein
MFASVLLFSPLIAMNHLIVSILYGDKFEQTAEILKYLAVGGFLQAMSSLSGVLLLALRATKELLKISLISASIYIIAFSLVFFRAASLIEYAIATCIASAFMALITAWKLSIMFPDLTFIIQLRQNLPYSGIIVLVFMLSF